MKAAEIVAKTECAVTVSGGNPDVVGITADSRRVHTGYIFAAIEGNRQDGREYIADAVSRGAVAVLSNQSVGGAGCVLVAEDVRRCYAEIAALLHGNPSQKMQAVGITGTNGKTTVAHMTRSVLERAGQCCGLLGTIAYEYGERRIAADRTTPDAARLQGLLREMVHAGCDAVVMEVSSHALDQERVAGVDFDVAVFTNLTPEHLDYHQGMEDYYEAKAKLFRELKAEGVAVINVDDEWGRRLMAEPLRCRKISYGCADDADVRAAGVEISGQGSRFQMMAGEFSREATLKLLGRHNISNALACVGTCQALGLDIGLATDVLAEMEPVRGRMEPVEISADFMVFIDYAHTGDALRHALETVREITPGRVIVVFGCGGERDREKRPVMGRMAMELADVAVVTSDNPRGEEPGAIIDEILAGMRDGKARVERCDERREAIRYALKTAGPGDSVLIAGKGHETYQEIGGRRTYFSDYETVVELAAG